MAVVVDLPPKGWKPSSASAAPATAATVVGGPSPDRSWDPWPPLAGAGAAAGAWRRAPMPINGADAAEGTVTVPLTLPVRAVTDAVAS